MQVKRSLHFEVQRIAVAIEPRYRVLVLLGAWSGLRWGELAGLSRQRIDRLHGVVRVEESMIQLRGDKRFTGPPKSAAGRRTVAVPTRRADVPDYHFHDPRHLAATMAAVSGATTRELMSRLGHSSSRAALIYQHATEDRDLPIAEAMSRLVQPTPLPSQPAVADG